MRARHRLPGFGQSLKFLLAIGLAASVGGMARAAPTSDAACLTCHADANKARRADGKSVLVDPKRAAESLHGKAGINCVDCHADLADLKQPSHKKKLAPVDCISCHDNMGAKHKFHPQMVANPKQVACQDCHGGHDIVGTTKDGFKFKGAGQIAACGKCHELMRDDCTTSVHGVAVKDGVKEAPDCIRCHTVNLTSAPEGSPKNFLKINQAKLCLSCHLDNAGVRAHVAPSAGFVAAFEKSVHGRALLAGNEKAPSCANCHGSHNIKKGQDSSAQVNRSHVQDACAECHEKEAKQFKESVHGVALAKGAVDAPTCTTCHGEHDILKHDDPTSPVSAKNVSQKVCAPCHQSVALGKKYGISSDRFQTFEDSFHGLAIRGGQVAVANCASCHGAHDIKPSADPTSRVHSANLAATCGKCHPGANEKFTRGAVHVSQYRATQPILYWISTLYLLMIMTVVGGMAAHNGIDFIKRSRHLLAVRRGEVAEKPLPHRLYLRMSGNERLQHAGMALSFIALVFTGFLLRYPDAGWVVALRHAWPGAFVWRAASHRVAAVLMTLSCAVHLGYVGFTPRGRQLIRDLFPRFKDATDAIGVVRYNLGLRKDKPLLDRFSYAEKLEYWALVWGTIVMTATGVVMWFDNKSMGIVTKLGYDVARTVHFYEAWLAFLAILVWHFYFVIFNPDAYPMNMSWLTGKISAREMEEDHPLEMERIAEREAEEQRRAQEAVKKSAPEPTTTPPSPDKKKPE